MRRFISSLLVAATLVFAAAADVAAQFPPASPEQRAAGSRVTEIRFGTEQLTVQRGETATLAVQLLDANGNQVEGAVAVVFAQVGVQPRFSTIAGPTIELSGEQPSEGSLMGVVMVPEAEGSMMGVSGVRQIGTLPAIVLDYPASDLEVGDLEYAVYAGTSQQMSGRVLTTEGTEHASASISWSSSDASVATLTEGGVLTGRSGGSVTLTGMSENGVSASTLLTVMENPVRSVTMEPASARARTGDVVDFDIVALDAGGNAVTDIAMDLAVIGLDGGAGFVYADGTFVAENPGAYRVLATTGTATAIAVVEVVEREAAVPVELISHAPVSQVATSDLWVFEGVNGRDYAYTGTHAMGGGERMFAWDVTDPANPTLTDSVVVNARVVNDVKVSDDASWAIITREGASTRRNGIVVLDLEDPAHPTVMAELTDSLTAGIHNVWIMGDVVYAVNDGTSAMNIIDMSDPANPSLAGRWELRPGDTDKSLHDVWAEDGYAYLSYWDDGLVILDVGAGTHGGTATEPAFVSSIAYPAGNTHVAWRDRDYVFLGDEIGTADGMRGYIHVIDVSDIDNPVEVAKYDLPEAGAHNVWVADETLYVAYYQGGLRMIDVSGTLRGDLYRQGREIGIFRTSAGEGEGMVPNSPQAWGPQVFKGHVFVSDMFSGLWVIKHARPRPITF
jgi:hypothetical protein